MDKGYKNFPLGINEEMDKAAAKNGLSHWSCVSPKSNEWWIRNDGYQFAPEFVTTLWEELKEFDSDYPNSTATQKADPILTANKYQELAGRTLLSEPDFAIKPIEVMLAWNALGLTGEAGEVADLVKKGVFHQQGIDREKLSKELGDVLWYVAAIAQNIGLSLEEVMWININKLQARFPEGYAPERTTVREGNAA